MPKSRTPKRGTSPGTSKPKLAKSTKPRGVKVHQSRAQHQRWRKDHQKKIRKLQTRTLQLSINQLSATRTLRASVRRAIRKKADKRLKRIIWAEELSWRYKPNAYPRAHLLSLPTEVRQQILNYTISRREIKAMTMWQIHAWVGTLSITAPLIRMELPYLTKTWYAEKEQQLAKLPKSAPERSEIARYHIPRLQEKKGEEIRVKGKKQKRYRAAKCWFCMCRHHNKDRVCTPQRQNPTEWVRTTIPLTKWKRDKLGLGGVQRMQGFRGKKTVFSDDGAVGGGAGV